MKAVSRAAAWLKSRLLGSGPQPKSAHTAYRGAERNRLWRGWDPPNRSGDAAIYEDYDLLNARLRDLFRNEPVMKKLRREMCKHVISAEGVQTFADVLIEDGPAGEQETDDAFNFEADQEFEHWAEEEADAEGKFSWPQMQWQAFGEALAGGGSMLLECWDDSPGRSIPLCYQVIEYEQLDTTKDRPAADGVNRIVRGIEFGPRNKIVAYWLFDAHPYDYMSGRGVGSSSQRVPASRVIHLYFPERPSDHIGASPFCANIQLAKDLDWLIGNELTSAALAALLTLIVKRDQVYGAGLGFSGGDANSTPGGSDEFGNSLVKWGRGVVADIGKNDSVDVAESSKPSPLIAPFADLLFQMHGMAAGLSHGRVTGSYKGTSYSAARAMHLDDQAYFVVLQKMVARNAVGPVRRRHTTVAAGLGRYTSILARQFKNRQHEMLRIDYQSAGREYLDPEAEGDAALQRIRGGLSTLKDECGLRGKSWRRIILQRKREIAFCVKHGMEPDLAFSATYQARRAAAGGKRDDTGEPAAGGRDLA